MHLPQADSARILVGAWWLVVLVIATTYCGNLVAFLTFPEMEKPLTTFDDLLSQKEYISWSMVEGSFIEEELQVLQEVSSTAFCLLCYCFAITKLFCG